MIRTILRILRASTAAAVAAMILGGVIRPAPDSTVAAQNQRAPRLVVLLVIDQFRYDYIDTYGQQWTHGLRRLVDEGAFFTNARYPYGHTVTCAGHSTLATGAFPARHGMIGNTWYDRTLRKIVTCAEDASAAPIALGGGAGKEHYSARSMLIPNFADELRRQAKTRPAQIVSVALKPRSAVSMGGHPSATTTVIWEEDDGTWATSDAYTSAAWPDAAEFVKSHPLANDYGWNWTPLLPLASYKYVDDGAGEGTPVPWTRSFPHPLISPQTGKPDNVFVTAWERSPRSDEFVTDLAITLLKSRKLGQQPGTDFLGVSLPAVDIVDHEFGPRSWEAQDMLARADVQVGKLLDALDAAVGRGNYLLAFASDHGVATLPEQLVAEGQDAGRITTTQITTALRPVLEAALGPAPAPPPRAAAPTPPAMSTTAPATAAAPATAPAAGASPSTPASPATTTARGTTTTPAATGVVPTWIAALDNAQITLLPGALDRLKQTPGAIDTVKSALTAIKGIDRVYGPDELSGTAPTSDACLTAWRLSYVPGRTGDFVMVVKPNWLIRATSGTTHGSCYDYDQHVPVIFYGKDVKKGRIETAITPADIVPTFASFVGITLPNAQGQAVLKR